MNDVALHIGPVTDGKEYRIAIGFANDHFSQVVNLPFTTVEDAEKLADHFRDAIIGAAKECNRQKLGIILPGKG